MRLIAAACLALALAAPVAAQGLPSSVSEPYRAYQAAMEAGDEAAALEPAYRAWQAAEDASVDAETTGLLADNYAALASAAGQHAQAAAAFARSAEILADTEGGTLLTAQTWRLAAQSAFRADDERSSRRYFDRAEAIVGRLPRGIERAREAFQLKAFEAYREYERGRTEQAGLRALEALEALRAAGAVISPDVANMAFFAGLRASMEYDYREAAYHFAIAGAIFRDAVEDERTLLVANAWAEYARNNLDERDERRLNEDLADSGYSFGGCVADVSCGPGVRFVNGFPEAREVVDATFLSGSPPAFPPDMEAAEAEGIAFLRWSVSEAGEVTDLEVLYSVPHSRFGEVSREAVSRWQYRPATADGIPVVREGVVTQFVFVFDD